MRNCFIKTNVDFTAASDWLGPGILDVLRTRCRLRPRERTDRHVEPSGSWSENSRLSVRVHVSSSSSLTRRARALFRAISKSSTRKTSTGVDLHHLATPRFGSDDGEILKLTPHIRFARGFDRILGQWTRLGGALKTCLEAGKGSPW